MEESKVNEIAEESKINICCPLALVSKILGREAKKESVEKENSEDEGLIVNSDDEVVAFYSNNRVKKLFRKPFNGKSKTNDGKGNFAAEIVNEEKKMKRRKKRNEKKSKIKDEDYYLEKLEEVRAKAKGLSLVAKGVDENEVLKRTKNLKFDSQSNYADIEDDSNDISEIEEEEVIGCSQLSVINVTSMAKGKEKGDDYKVKVDTTQPSTSKVHDHDHVTVEGSQTYSDDDDDVSKETTKHDDVPKKIPRVVVDQFFDETEKFDKIMKEKGSHYLEKSTVVYPNFKCTDDVIFPNQVFVTTGNSDKIKPEFNNLVGEDNKKASKEGFFANQSTVENNLTKNSYTFQRQKPQRKQVEKSENSNEVPKPVENASNHVKINFQEFKEQIEKISKESGISKRQAKKKVFWQNYQNHVSSQKISNQKFDEINNKINVNFTPKQPKFPKPAAKQFSKVSCVKGNSYVKNINHWLEGKEKSFQSTQFSQQQIKEAYEKYFNESSNGSSSKDSQHTGKQWRPISKAKVNEKCFEKKKAKYGGYEAFCEWIQIRIRTGQSGYAALDETAVATAITVVIAAGGGANQAFQY
ncbi:uncharacterized protein LOC128132402 [Lactuca sativa]|uniref:uncharacterized protein LOC128132402 n=1 Tax=Lactuca sativa TaxID=4236 RepID=UPI0022B05EE8|nr:uncharacterized protein LOC128132402 [Lactuca sativa]